MTQSPVSRAPLLFFGVALAVAFFSTGAIAMAGDQPSKPCATLSRYLHIGSRDGSTGSEVSALQSFLATQGYFSNQTTGYFGPITFNAVQNFQRSQGIASIGYVGPLTRGAIQRVSCGARSGTNIQSLLPGQGVIGTQVVVRGSGFTADNTIIFGGGAIMHVASYDGATLSFTVPDSLNPACYYSEPRCLIASRQTTPGDYTVYVQNGNGTSNAVNFTVVSNDVQMNPSIYFLTPTTGQVGTQVNITGFGFTNDNTVLMGGLVAARDVPVSSSIAIACTTDPNCRSGIRQTIVFTIPSSISPNCPPGSMCPMFLRQVTPGSYAITVQDANGTSNAMTFVVNGDTSNQAPAISGLDAPTQLAIGQSGTWTVHVSAPSTTGNLHYSVVWGDENRATASGIMMPAPSTIQTSATFTHVYSRSGTFTPTFTVTNDAGQSATMSATITVAPLY